MFNFVAVLPMLLAAASAGVLAPVAGPLAYAHPYGYAAHGHGINIAHAPALSYSASAINTIAAPALSYAAAPALSYAAAPALSYAAAPAISYAAAPVAVAAPITKTVHYENRPVVTGYTSQILKPAFPGGAGLATPAEIVSKQTVLAPARSVQTVIPQVTQIQPEAHIQRVAVDVPVAKPYPVEQVVRTVAAPAHITVAAPAPITYAAAPAQLSYAAAPAQLSYAAAPAQLSYAAAPAHLGYAAYGNVHGLAYGQGYGYGANLIKTVY